VTGDFDQAAQMHGVSDALSADLVGPLVQLRKAGGPALAEPFKQIEFGKFGHG
jgi:hypothetical protein